MDSMMDLNREYEETIEKVKGLKEGSVVSGKIVQVDEKEVLVDIGYKAEGVVSLDEFPRDEKGLPYVKDGDEIKVFLLNREDNMGRILLSYRKAMLIAGWDKVNRAFESAQPIEAKILDEKKSASGKLVGFTVDIDGIRGFLPLSAVDMQKNKKTGDYIGKKMELKVIELDKNTHNVVLSRKVLLDETRKKQSEELFNSLRIGDVREGTVKTLTAFGAFVDLGGIDGLVHINDLSWGRKKPEDVLKLEDKVKVMVLDFDKKEQKISLGLKHLKPDPWSRIEERYPAGKRVQGKIVKVAAFGAFVELEEGIEGLARLEDLTWNRSIKHPSKIIKEGDESEFMVLSLNREERKLALGLKQVQPDPWFVASQKYPSGTKVKGKIVKITSFGAFVRIDDEMDGLIRLKDISWTKKIKHPSEIFSKNRDVEAVVLKVDRENKKISLGMKQLLISPWEKYKKGMHVKGKVTKIEDFGACVSLEENIEGFIHISELSSTFVNKPEEVISVDQELDLKVIKVNAKDKKIELSLKGHASDVKKTEISTFINNQERDTTTLGDIAPHLKQR